MGEFTNGKELTSRMPARYGSVLSILADETSRDVISYFRETDGEVASNRELVDWIAPRREGESAKTLELRLHHVTLPKLREEGVIDYDTRHGTVRYCAPDAVCELSKKLQQPEG